MTDQEVNRLFSFSVGSQHGEDNGEGSAKKQRIPRDPMSHRIIEKRRRDRMNNCLADLSQLIPATFMKQGQGRIEKTEIIEMAIKHIKYLQSCLHGKDVSNGEGSVCSEERFIQGYQECQKDTCRYLEQMGCSSNDTLYQSLKNHLESQINQYKANIVSMKNEFTKKQQLSDSMSGITSSQSESLQGPSSQGGNSQMSCEASRQFQPSFRQSNADDYQQSSGNQGYTESMSGLTNDVTMVQDDQPKRDSGQGSSTLTSSGQASSDTASSGTSSGFIGLRRDSDNKGAYKFKHDIQQRFIAVSGEKKPNGKESSTSKSASISDEKEEFKDPLPFMHNLDNSSECASNGNGTGSNYSGSVSVKSFASNDSSNSVNSGSNTDTSLNNTVPAFALHPMGVFYIPVVLPISQVMPFICNHKAMGVCHPISIPVSFTGPFPMGTLCGPTNKTENGANGNSGCLHQSFGLNINTGNKYGSVKSVKTAKSEGSSSSVVAANGQSS